MDKSIERSNLKQLKQMLYFSYSFTKDELEVKWPWENGKSELVEFERFNIISDNQLILSFDPLSSYNASSSLLKTSSLGDDIYISQLPDDPNLQVFSMSGYIQFQLEKLFSELIHEVRLNQSEKFTRIIYDLFRTELHRFKVFVLEERIDLLKKQHPSLWGIEYDSEVHKCIDSYQTNFEAVCSTRRAEGQIDNRQNGNMVLLFTLHLLDRVVANVDFRLERLISALNPDDDGTPEITNNGLFFYQGPKQIARLKAFLVENNDNIVPKSQSNDWLMFLSGQALPSKPLTWNGAKTHFILLLKHSGALRDKQQHTPIELFGSQPSWLKLADYVVFKDGKALTSTDACRTYDVLKDSLANKAKYISDLFEGYMGEG